MSHASRLLFRGSRGADAVRRDGSRDRIRMLDVVQLKRGRPQEGVLEGATGTVVEIFESPEPAYEVEFLDAEGEFIAEIPVSPDELSLVERPKSTKTQ